MKKVILKVLFKNTPHFLDLVMTENEAKEMIKQWANGENRKAYNYDKNQDRHWGISFADVASIFTMDLEALQQQMRLQQAGQPSQPPSQPIFGNRPN